MVRWYTADHHFGHHKVIEYCNRPFEHACRRPLVRAGDRGAVVAAATDGARGRSSR